MSNSDGNVDAGLSENSLFRTNSTKKSQLDGQSTEAADMSLWNAGFFGRSNSDASVFSEATDDASSFASGSPSPSHWLGRGMLKKHVDDQELEEALMKERFAYLMLGGDISGGGNRHCPARTVSDAITNLYSSTLDSYNKLEPLELDRRANWRREMKFLLAPCDLISVCDDRMEEDAKTGQLRQVQVRIAPRADMISCLPALKMLENLLLEMMDSFEGIGLAYDGSPSSNNDNPIPLVPEGGFSKKSRRLLKKQHESATQVYKAASHINSSAIADMDIPQSYTESLPKTAKAILGGVTYHHMLTVEPFKPDELVDNFNLTSEHKALETVDKLEAAIAIWSRKASGLQAKPWWKVVKEFVTDADIPDKNTVLAKRAETTIMRIKCRYPQFPQTSLEGSKIENNKDMGKAVLETYSRVLESLALKLVSLIEGVMVADGLILPEGKISV